jgi:hypothetical protein
MSHETFELIARLREKALASDARTPIALSMVSEVIAVTHGKSGSPLSASVSVRSFSPQGGEKVPRSGG